MKTYTVTVNGIAYDVAVEETTGRPVREYRAAAPAPVAAPVAAAAPAPAPAAAPVEEAVSPAVTAGGTKGRLSVESPMPGKILSVKTSVGQAVKRGDVILVLEAMKMENEIVAPEDGVVASIDVSSGASVESGTLLATLN
ncbi:Biotin carboxyl carrier protein [Anaerocolumna jejuensis DSM 15929]|uniref:Biotin carboxyl carrier protein n=1 Tax=Anaerocolumna jejuensis DSM 15929 TaxID=1121322 RepID=A0A1M6K227_9FIRM|nr:biotin/lipoyl-containing protein [Anaerocolumna jejuensis]SHJ52955.1 Biotin carboxyl carrier protein [Anaerocolumna jejuensis DSM 15929]